MIGSFTDLWMFVGLVALAAGVITAGVSLGNRRVFYSLIALLLFHTLAIPGSLLWGNGNWELTAGVVMWMAPALLLYLANDPRRVFEWLVPAWLIHSGIIIYQGFTKWGLVGEVAVRYGDPSGLSNNSNLDAGFLALGIVYLLTTPLKWLTAPLFVALLFTGSRWGVLVVVGVVLAMAIARTVPWRVLVVAALAMVVTVGAVGMLTPQSYAVAGVDSFAGVVHSVQVDVGSRLAIPHLPTFLPSGVAEHPGLHNVPLRIAVENGLVAAVIWVLITGWALLQHYMPQDPERCTDKHAQPAKHHPFINTERYYKIKQFVHNYLLLPFRWLLAGLAQSPFTPLKRVQHDNQEHDQTIDQVHSPVVNLHADDQRHNDHRGNYKGDNPPVHRWLLLTLVLLSVLDYYTWMGHLGGFWWLLIGLLLKR